MFIDHYKTLININKHIDAIKYSGVMFHLNNLWLQVLNANRHSGAGLLLPGNRGFPLAAAAPRDAEP